MRGEHVRQRAERKSAVLLSSVTAYYPRVRTCHTKKPSRFVHALSARPLDNGCRGRDSSTCADGMESIFFIFDVCCTRTLSCRGRRRRDRGTDRFSHFSSHNKKISSSRGDFFYAHYFFERFFIATMIPASISATEIPSRSPEKKSFTGDPPIPPDIA